LGRGRCAAHANGVLEGTPPPRVRRNRTSGPLSPYGFEVRNPNHRVSVPHVEREGWERECEQTVEEPTAAAGQEESNLWAAKPLRI
jgi:hypothetical protein